MKEPLKISENVFSCTGSDILVVFISFLGFLMNMFQTPILPELSPLEESKEQFEVFCRKSGKYHLYFSVHDVSLLYFLFALPTSPHNFEISSCLIRCGVKKPLLS